MSSRMRESILGEAEASCVRGSVTGKPQSRCISHRNRAVTLPSATLSFARNSRDRAHYRHLFDHCNAAQALLLGCVVDRRSEPFTVSQTGCSQWRRSHCAGCVDRSGARCRSSPRARRRVLGARVEDRVARSAAPAAALRGARESETEHSGRVCMVRTRTRTRCIGSRGSSRVSRARTRIASGSRWRCGRVSRSHARVRTPDEQTKGAGTK